MSAECYYAHDNNEVLKKQVCVVQHAIDSKNESYVRILYMATKINFVNMGYMKTILQRLGKKWDTKCNVIIAADMTSNHDFIHETPTQKSIVDFNRSTPISNRLQSNPDNYFKTTSLIYKKMGLGFIQNNQAMIFI